MGYCKQYSVTAAGWTIQHFVPAGVRDSYLLHNLQTNPGLPSPIFIGYCTFVPWGMKPTSRLNLLQKLEMSWTLVISQDIQGQHYTLMLFNMCNVFYPYRLPVPRNWFGFMKIVCVLHIYMKIRIALQHNNVGMGILSGHC